MNPVTRIVRWIAEDGKRGFVAGLVAALIGASAMILAMNQAQPPEFSSDPDRARIERIVRDYIYEHPEIIPEAVKRLQDREAARTVEAHRRELETPFGSAWAGAADGDVVLVEFFDYACSYCRASNPDVERLLREDPKLKVVWRELPVLGEESVAAARLSLAAAKQGHFRAFHDRLFAAGPPNERSLAAVRKAVGITAASPQEIEPAIHRNFELARIIGVTGTPVFVVGGKVLQGAVGYQVLKEAIAEARKNG